MESDSFDLTISVPTVLADPGAAERARLLLVLDAVRTERMTWRVAARALGLAADVLLGVARQHGVPVVRYDAHDLDVDLATLEKLDRLRNGG